MRLDVRGEICPYPMMRTVDALEKLPANEELEVLFPARNILGSHGTVLDLELAQATDEVARLRRGGR